MGLLKISVLLSLFTFLCIFYYPALGISGAFYADNGRGQSVLYQSLAKQDKLLLQEEILSLLGLKHRPKKRPEIKHTSKNDPHKSSAEKFLLRLYRALVDSSARENFCRGNKTCISVLQDSDYIISFQNKIREISHIRHERDRGFYFDVSQIHKKSEIVKAELRVFRNMTSAENHMKKHKYRISLYKVENDDYYTKTFKIVDEVITGSKSRGWLVFNITTTLMKWVSHPYTNLGLYFKIVSLHQNDDTAYDINPREIGIFTSDAPSEHRAFMVAYFKTTSQMHMRNKRAAKRKQFTSHYSQNGFNPYRTPQDKYIPKTRSCERWALYVSFRDLGFEDWIIAPDGYAAFYCDGSCMFPLNAQMNATNHAIVQTLMHLMDPTAVPKPSCAPTQLSSITVLYFDDNSNVILKKYKNMVVKACGCH